MSAPRVEIDLAKLRHNAHTLVERLHRRGILVTAVTKATLGMPEVARELLAAGVAGLGDSRLENIVRMRDAGIVAPITLIRSPMLSEVDRVVDLVDTSCNTEVEVIRALSAAAGRAGREHGVVVMVELGDLREGVMPSELPEIARLAEGMSGVVLRGIGTNLACQNGVAPDASNMAELSALAAAIEVALGRRLDVVSGGNSASIGWALGHDGPGRVDDLRLGESILLGLDPLHRTRIDGLHTDVFTLVVEVIESRQKPSVPWGSIAEGAFGPVDAPLDRGVTTRSILAIGRQDVDPDGLTAPAGIELLGASSDHLVVVPTDGALHVGDEVRFGLDYSALVRVMTSPFVAKIHRSDR